jgi:hypothetical protein
MFDLFIQDADVRIPVRAALLDVAACSIGREYRSLKTQPAAIAGWDSRI